MAKKKALSKKTRSTKKADTLPQDPLDAAVRLTGTELLKLGKISAEMRFELLSTRVAIYEAQEIRAQGEAQLRSKQEEIQAWVNEEVKKREANRVAHHAEARRMRTLYDHLTAELANKYGIEDPKYMVVDPDTGVVRDSRNL